MVFFSTSKQGDKPFRFVVGLWKSKKEEEQEEDLTTKWRHAAPVEYCDDATKRMYVKQVMVRKQLKRRDIAHHSGVKDFRAMNWWIRGVSLDSAVVMTEGNRIYEWACKTDERVAVSVIEEKGLQLTPPPPAPSPVKKSIPDKPTPTLPPKKRQKKSRQRPKKRGPYKKRQQKLEEKKDEEESSSNKTETTPSTDDDEEYLIDQRHLFDGQLSPIKLSLSDLMTTPPMRQRDVSLTFEDDRQQEIEEKRIIREEELRLWVLRNGLSEEVAERMIGAGFSTVESLEILRSLT